MLAGRITGCFGIKGQLKVELAGGDPARAMKLRRVWIGATPESAEPLTVTEAKVEGGKVRLRFEGYEDRTKAERLRGLSVFVEPAEAAKPPKGRAYVHDMIGCEVRTRDGQVLGTIDDVFDAAGRHLWSVRRGDLEFLFPAERAFIVSVDTKKKMVVVDPPEGLPG